MNDMRILTGLAVLATLAGCAQVREPQALPAIQAEVRQAAAEPAGDRPLPAAVEQALLPGTRLPLPRPVQAPLEPRFDLVVTDAPASQVFLGIASGSRYSMLLPPGLDTRVSVNLKDVTVPEALDAMRELYGYDYRIDGSRVFIQPASMQTRFYAIAYPASVREGRSEVRVISGSVTDGNGAGGAPGATPAAGNGGGGVAEAMETSRLSTTLKSDFWGELKSAVALLINCLPGTACLDGRSVVTSPQAGMLAVRALPGEQRLVGEYLKAAKLTVERQVMIEAKIIEVGLNEDAQTGVNWSALGTSTASPFALSSNIGGATLPSPAYPFLNRAADFGALNVAATKGIVGLAFQTDSFAALIQFLQSQGSVQVLSSPRIAALNNQKAVLKVGVDEFFVTNVSTTTNTGTGGGTTTPNVTLQPFFSGIALDVTPQIDDADNIILHIHPTVSQVSTVEKTIDLGGSTLGALTLPLASSAISETDSVVRLKDGQIAAIGGLMKRESRDDDSHVPVLGEVPLLGALFKNNRVSRQKQELVILLKPTLIKGPADWAEGARAVEARLSGGSD
jgi:MSHA biogenesis protein MshL